MNRRTGKHWMDWSLLTTLILTVLLVGCGGGSAEPEPTVGPPPSVGSVRVGISPGWEPWVFTEPATGELVGFDIDLMKAIAEEAEFEVEFVEAPFDQLLDNLGVDYDVAASALLVTDERTAQAAFSDAYQEIGLVLVIPSWNRAVWGIADVSGKKVGAIGGSREAAEVEAVDPSALVEYQDYDTMFADLAADERSLDVIVCDYLVAVEYIAKTPGILKTSAAFTGEKLAIAVDKSRPELLAAVNAGLESALANYLVKDIVTDWLAVAPADRPEGFVLHGGR